MTSLSDAERAALDEVVASECWSIFEGCRCTLPRDHEEAVIELFAGTSPEPIGTAVHAHQCQAHGETWTSEQADAWLASIVENG